MGSDSTTIPQKKGSTMAEHRIEIHQPPKEVLHSNVSLIVYSDNAALGELKVSKGTIDWRPAGHTKSVQWTWERFAKVMSQKG
jgi:hypothetical protein